MEKRIQFELVLRAKDTTIHDEKTGFHVVHELAFPIEADWNYDKPDLPAAAIIAMTQLDTMHHFAKNFIEKAKSVPIDGMMVTLISEVTNKLRKAPPPTCEHGKTGTCQDCFVI